MNRFLIFMTFMTLMFCAGVARAQDGPAAYTVMGPISRLPNDGRPETKVPFPEIKDWNTLKITLTRGPCFGSCPAYSVEIDGDGTVRYNGKGWVAIEGIHTAKIPHEAVTQLVEEFRKADFFWLLDSYFASVTDFPSFSVAIAFDGTSKSVLDYVGTAIGMPKEVRALEAKIDAVAGIEKWVKGNDETLAALRAEGWDFSSKSKINQRLLETSAMRSPGLTKELLAAGVTANTSSGCVAAQNALVFHNQATFDALIAAGAPNEAVAEGQSKDHSCSLLLAAAENGNLAAVQAMIDRHAHVNLQDGLGRTALFVAVQSWVFSSGGSQSDRPKIIKLLLAAGADPEIASTQNLTPLAYAQKWSGRDLDKLQMITDLIASGPRAGGSAHGP